MKHPKNRKKMLSVIAVAMLGISLLVSLGFNFYLTVWKFDSYLQTIDQIQIMTTGILHNDLAFRDGIDYKFIYDFENEAYQQLIGTYGIVSIAGDGSEFEKGLRLMDKFAPRLRHESNFDNHIEINALSLLEYSLDNKNQGINCRCKAQILNEMCLALGIYSRKVWIMPNSLYDRDCHVVNELWDSSRNKWIMLDITNNEYWVDAYGMPLSILEIRHKGAMQEFCTPVKPGDSLDDLEALREKYTADFLYIMKNMVYTQYCDRYTVGESSAIYTLLPVNLDPRSHSLISKRSCEHAPVREE